MTPRENLLSLFKRQGYNYAPVDLELCPSLQEDFHREVSESADFRAYFKLPWRRVEDGNPPSIHKQIYINYYSFTLKEGTFIDRWGVAHEPGSEAAKHMTYMRHPMKELTELDEIIDYPYPDYFNGDFSHQKSQVQEIHNMGLAAVGDMQLTIWADS